MIVFNKDFIQFDVVGLVQSSTTEKLSPSVRPSVQSVRPVRPVREATLGFGPNLLVAYCYSTCAVQSRQRPVSSCVLTSVRGLGAIRTPTEKPEIIILGILLPLTLEFLIFTSKQHRGLPVETFYTQNSTM